MWPVVFGMRNTTLTSQTEYHTPTKFGGDTAQRTALGLLAVMTLTTLAGLLALAATAGVT